MAYASVLLHVDDTRACSARVDAALAVAGQHGAHVTALYCIAHYVLPAWMDADSLGIDRHIAAERERAERVLEDFATRAGEAGIEFATERVFLSEHSVATELAIRARCFDLTVVGQADPDEPTDAGRNLAAQVAVASGAPLLVIPYIGPVRDAGKVVLGHNVMIAWDGGREAAHAVRDALPALVRAERINLIAINPERYVYKGREAIETSIVPYLAHHGVELGVEVHETEDISAGDLILSRLSDEGKDLLVMGAYAHSRVREFVLGGVTRNMLEHMTVPVLMSH